jgi:hypothetical protein
MTQLFGMPAVTCMLAAIACAAVTPLGGQESQPTPLARLSSPIELDGHVVEAAWKEIAPLPLTMYTPVYRGQPTEHTEIRLAYDDDYVYASGRFFDSSVEGIRTNSLYRDRWSGDDAFALYIDSFNDNQSARRFTITPAGTRIDELYGADGQEANLAWDSYWEARTTRDDEGWYFEIRIPFSSLRFQEMGDAVIMGITATRLIARKNERVTFPDIDPRFSFRQPSVAHDFQLRGIRPARPAYLTPYVLGGLSRATVPAASSTFRTDDVSEAGLDLKYSLTDNVFVDLSVNTDFAQVEADDEQINLTRFPLFFPEKRQFFQERSDLFLFDFANGGRLFHSRRIGLSDDRLPVRILGGARVAGRHGTWDFGALSMQSDEHQGVPGENFGVLRLKRRIFNPYSYAGAIFTSRLATDGTSALAGGLDASIRPFGDHYTTVKWAMTENPSTSETSPLDQSQVHFEWARRADRGLRYWIRFNRAGQDYSPSLGFLPRPDFFHNSLYAVYATRGREGDLLQSFGPGIIINSFYTNGSMDLESLYAGHWWEYLLWNGASGWLQVTHRFERVDAPFEVGEGVMIPAGDHRFTNVWFNFTSGPGSKFRTSFNARVGTFYDGTQVELTAGPTVNISRHLELGGEYEANFLTFSDRAEAVGIHVARLRLRSALNVRMSATALLQYNSNADVVGVNVRARYNMREGTDLWLVYDEGLNTERTIDGIPEAIPLSQSRAVRIKFTYTFAL